MFTRFKAISFDCYGTLIDWESGILAELAPWARDRGLRAAPDELLEAFGALELAAEADAPRLPYPEILARVHAGLAERFGTPPDPAAARSFGASVGRWPAFADSAEALRALKTRFRLIILSNVDRASFAKSQEKLGVAFDLVLTAQDIGSYKPDPRNFEALLGALDGLGVKREELLHAAQSKTHDIVPAKKFGLPAVWIDRRRGRAGWGATAPPSGDSKPDLSFESMAAFAEATSSC